MRTPIVAGNWKMHKTIAEVGVEVVLCPPFTALHSVRDTIGPAKIGLGAQNMYFEEQGAFTGEVSPPMLAELCQYIILGHSERRQFFGETDEGVNKKAKAALAFGLKPIICVGEHLEQNQAGDTEATVGGQVRGPLADRYGEAVAQSIRVQYGGSVKPDNMTDFAIQSEIDGALVGGASLKVDSFLGIIKAASGEV